jgi:hypothetical protein
MIEFVAVVCAVVVWAAPIPADIPEQCDSPTFARANPGLCGDDLFPFPRPPRGGDGDDGGLIGRIIRGIGNLI